VISMAEPVSDLIIPYDDLAQTLQSAGTGKALWQAIVDAPFDYRVETAFLFLGFICFFLVDEEQATLCLASASSTEEYERSIQGYNFDPDSYRIALDSPNSPLVAAINSGEPQNTSDWASLTRPQASENAARLNQANSGVTYSVVYPLTGTTRGVLMYNYVQYQGFIGSEQHGFMEKYTQLVAGILDEAV
jgi:hypothetical protein